MRTSSLPFLLALLTLPALAAQPKKRSEDHVQGKELWEKSCWQCHGEENDGKGPAAEALVDDVPDLRGKIGPKRYDALVQMVMSGSPTHPAFSAEMDEHQAKRILIYLDRLDRESKREPPETAPPEEKDDATDEE